MGYGTAIGLFFKRYFEFNGRSGRAEYWWPTLTLVVLTLGLIIAGAVMSEGFTDFGPLSVTLFLVLAVLVILTFIPSIALNVRRLHDFNQTGWIYLGVFVAGMLISLVQIIAMVVIGVIEGTKGPNKYGDDPLNPAESVATTFD